MSTAAAGREIERSECLVINHPGTKTFLKRTTDVTVALPYSVTDSAAFGYLRPTNHKVSSFDVVFCVTL